jgi:hypothetical protein
MDRRNFLETSAALTWLGATNRVDSGVAAASPLAFRLIETAGIRRYGYPVSVRVPLDDPVENLRLTHEGLEVPAQFRRLEGPGARDTILDFDASPGPFEASDYLILAAEVKPARPSSDRGMRATARSGWIEVTNSPHITYSLSDDLGGFLRSVSIPGVEFLQPRSGGLFVSTGGPRSYLGAPPVAGGDLHGAVVTRQGPHAVGVAFDHLVTLGRGPALAWSLSLTFPSTKSWVEAAWSIADPEDRVRAMGVDLNLLLEGSPVLVDCGARSTVYSTLEARDRLAFEAGHPLSAGGRDLRWQIGRGHGEPLSLEAAGLRQESSGPEGWVHAMDSRRCTAMAVASFGEASAGRLDRFEIEGNGLLRFERRFDAAGAAPGPGKSRAKGLRFWIHFVTMPVQVGAKTSPQAMLAPLEVRWQKQ